jgi:hypothetical protein
MEETELLLVEGDRDDRVTQHKVPLDEITVLGCCGVQQVQNLWDAQNPQEMEPVEETVAPQQNSYIAQTANYTVTVTCGSEMILPEGAELQVSEYPKDSDIYRQRCQEAGYELEWLLNIGFFLDGEELQVAGDARQQRHVGKTGLGFPFAYSLCGNAEKFRQFLLTCVLFHAQRADLLSDIH